MNIPIIKFWRNHIHLLILALAATVYLLAQLNLFQGLTWQTYPYQHQDFWRRMDDTYYYLGLRDSSHFHPPLSSLMFAGLQLLGINQLFIINFAAFIGFGFLIYFLANRYVKNSTAALLATVMYFFSFYIIQQANYLGLYDLLASFLITLALFVFLSNWTKTYAKLILTGIILGLAGLVQYSGIFLLPLLCLGLLLKKESWLAKIKYCFALGLPASIIFSSFFVWRWFEFGDPFYSQVEHFGFLGFTLSNLSFYLFATIAVFSVPGILLALVGLVNWPQSQRLGAGKFLMLSLPVAAFFLFFYKWADWRFIVYLIPAIFILIASGIDLILSKIKQNPLLTGLSVISFLVTLLYINLYPMGIFGIIIGPNSIIRDEVSYDNGEPTHTLIVDKFDNALTSYLFNRDPIEQRLNKDSELAYFNRKVDYQDAEKIMHVIGSDTFVLDLKDERFVRFHQFSVASSRVVVMDANEADTLKSKYIVSDHLLTRVDFRLVSTSNNLYIYENSAY